MKLRAVLLAAFMAAFLMVPAKAAMGPLTIPIKMMCWTALEEAIELHKKRRGEYPIIKMTCHHAIGPGGAVLLVRPDKTKWTFLMFRYNNAEERLLVCAFAVGQNWFIAKPPKIEEPKGDPI